MRVFLGAVAFALMISPAKSEPEDLVKHLNGLCAGGIANETDDRSILCFEGVGYLNDMLSERQRKTEFWTRAAEDCLSDLMLREPNTFGIRRLARISLDMCLEGASNALQYGLEVLDDEGGERLFR